MRKVLIITITILLLVLAYFTVTKGNEILGLKISSVKQIEEENTKLKAKIEDINTLIDVEYPKKIGELKTASNKLETEKEEYLKYTNMSTDNEILQAMQKKSYAIEFLWTKIGMHAREEGVNLKFEIVSSSTGANNVNDLKFTVDGSYIGITNYIYSLENDTELNFVIENFKLLPYQNEILQATFTVRNIAIQGNTSNESIQQSSQSTTNNITTDNSNSNTLSTSTAQEAGRNAISNGVQNMKDSVTNSMQNNQ